MKRFSDNTVAGVGTFLYVCMWALIGFFLISALACDSATAPPAKRIYLVTITPGTSVPGVRHSFPRTLPNVVSVALDDEELEALRQQPGVLNASLSQPVSTQWASSTPSWGLDRLDQRNQPLDGSYSPPNDGSGGRAYVIDTGASPGLPEFEGRVDLGLDVTGGNGLDCHGHGTHVTSTAVGRVYGVSPGAAATSVRALDCGGFGTSEGVIQAIEWAVQDALARGTCERSVISMSLGTLYVDSALNAATDNAVNACMPVVVAAGNSQGNACNSSPSSAVNAITVAASDSLDNHAWFSNSGACVDLYAPGLLITAMWNNGKPNTISGTSMATPHVTGLVLQAQVRGDVDAATVVSNATFGVLHGANPNLLAHAGVALSAPTNLRVVVYWQWHAHVLWQDNSAGEHFFELERSTDNGASWALIATFAGGKQEDTLDQVIRATDLFRIRATVPGSPPSLWSGSAVPSFLTSTQRFNHVHR